jgi:hypothetical protein
MDNYLIPIPPKRDDELAIGVDINQEKTKNVVIISPDWNSVLRKNHGKVLNNTLEEKSWTSYVNDELHSELACRGVNVLSGEIAKLVGRIRRIKKNKNIIQRSISYAQIHSKTEFKSFIEKLYRLCSMHGISAKKLRDVSNKIRQAPAHYVHKLKELRAQRKIEISQLFQKLSAKDIVIRPLEELYKMIQISGKRIYRLTCQLRGHQSRLSALRKELMRNVSRITAAVIASERPLRFGYEALHVNPQGLKGGLAIAAQYMPKDDEVRNAIELVKNFYKRKRVLFDIEVFGVDPRGTSQPPHIPSNRSFIRKRGQWNIITIPADPQHGLLELRFNSHILSSQKIAAKAFAMHQDT